MPGLVHCSGKDGLQHHGRRYFHSKPTDTSNYPCPIASRQNTYHHPCKKQRIAPTTTSSSSSSRSSSSLSKLCPNEETPEQNSPISSLPDECHFEILRRLASLERTACAQVSKHWLILLSRIRRSELHTTRDTDDTNPLDELEEEEEEEEELVDDDHLTTRCLYGKKATDLRLMAVTVEAAARGGLRELSIGGNHSSFCSVTDLGLSSVARGCPSLRSLSLWNVQLVTDAGLREIGIECPSLERLDLSHCPSVTDKSLIAIAENCPNLRTLTIESCQSIGNEGLKALGSHCSKLESVSIKDCPLVSDEGIMVLVSSPSAPLAKLRLRGLIKVGDFALAAIGHYGKWIKNLLLCDLRSASEKGFWAMGAANGLQSLQCLTIVSCMGLTDFGLQAIARGVGGGCGSIRSSGLKALSLVKCCFVSDSGVMAFFGGSSSSLEYLYLEEINRFTLAGAVSVLSSRGSMLKSLSLVKCMGVNDVVAEDIGCHGGDASRCRSLWSLSISNCHGVGNAGLVVLGSLCPKVRNIDLIGLHRVTDEGILCFLQTREAGLVKVNLSRCVNLQDEGVILMAALLHGGTLRVLNLGGCSMRITDSSLEAMARTCKRLVDLDMSSCGITDRGIRVLTSLPRVKVLSVADCPGVSDGSLEYLISMGDSLDGLNVKGCDLVRSGRIDLLLDGLPGCNILF